MYYQVKKKRRWRLQLFILAVVGSVGYFTYTASGNIQESIYVYSSSDSIQRVIKRVDELDVKWQEQRGNPADFIVFLRDTLKILETLDEQEKAVAANYFYYRALINYHELVFRLNLTPLSLIELSGRGLLPAENWEISIEETLPIADLAWQVAADARKSLALDPTFADPSKTNSMIAMADFIHTGRTDNNLNILLNRVDPQKLSPFERKAYGWLATALMVTGGEKEALKQIADHLFAPPGAPDSAGNQPDRSPGAGDALGGIIADVATRDLLYTFCFFNAADYYGALIAARELLKLPNTPEFYRVEATRMEGEIFLIQRGAASARPYFQEALSLSRGDPLLKERLESLPIR